MATKMKKDCIYKNKHNHRVVQCVEVRMSDYGIATYTLQDIAPNESGFGAQVQMTDLDAHHWTQIAGRTKIHEVPRLLARQEGYAYRTRARKEDEEE